jgi:hypothetical protein
MDALDWLEKMEEELAELMAVGELRPDDAFRALVLVARLQASPEGKRPPEATVGRLGDLLAAAPDVRLQELLDSLADALEGDEDPAGRLHDALLDVDDAAGVLQLAGRTPEATDLVRRAAALVSLHPQRLLALVDFAGLRLDTIHEQAVETMLWSAVMRAPAELLASALPHPVMERRPPAELLIQAGLLYARRTAFRVPRRYTLAAAQSRSEATKLEGLAGDAQAWLEEDNGELRLEIKGLSTTARAVELHAVDLTDGAVLGVRRVELSGRRTRWASLGKRGSDGDVLRALLRDVHRPPDEVAIEVIVIHE